KPGIWMERFKIAMGFPMAATAMWLVSLMVPHYGDQFWWLGMFLVVVALAAWIFGTFVQRGSRRRGLAVVVIAVLLAGGYAYMIEAKLKEAAGIVWEPWSAEAIAKARTEHRPVLVDFTAVWCVTCNANNKPVIESKAVQKKLKEI